MMCAAFPALPTTSLFPTAQGLPFWGWISTLVAALYFDYGTVWVVAAYAFATVTRLLDGLENNKVKHRLLLVT